MRRPAPLLLLPLLLATGPVLLAQSPHMGFSLNLLVPSGAFASQSYPAYYSLSSGRTIPAQKESYDIGLGGSFTVSFPVDRNLAVRLNLSGSQQNGTNRAPGESTINLRHSQFNLGGDLQIFPGGTAFRHRGLYFMAGLSADFEQFDRSFGGPQLRLHGHHPQEPSGRHRWHRAHLRLRCRLPVYPGGFLPQDPHGQ